MFNENADVKMKFISGGKAGGFGAPRNQYNIFGRLEDWFTYDCTDSQKSGWRGLRYSPSRRAKSEPARRGSRTHPIPILKKPLTGRDVYKQNNLFANAFELEVPRNQPPLGDPTPPAPSDVSATYEGGLIKVCWVNPAISSPPEVDIALVRIVMTLTTSRIWNGDELWVWKKGRFHRRTIAVFKIERDKPLFGQEHTFSEFPANGDFETPAIKIKDIYRGVVRIQMQTCVAYKNHPSIKGSLRGVRVSSSSNLCTLIIKNER